MTETVFSHVDRPTMVKLLSKVFGGGGTFGLTLYVTAVMYVTSLCC